MKKLQMFDARNEELFRAYCDRVLGALREYTADQARMHGYDAFFVILSE